MNNIIHPYHSVHPINKWKSTFDGIFEGPLLGDIFDDFKRDLALLRGLGEFLVEVVCLGLGANGAANRVAFLEELDKDVGADEAAWAGDEDEGCHF